MRIIASIEKRDSVKFVSHLDLQRMLHRAISRAELPIRYSEGFNPHPLVSFASALSVGQTSKNEWIDIRLEDGITSDEFMTRLNESLPNGFKINKAYEVREDYPKLTSHMTDADYEAVLISDDDIDADKLNNAIDTMMKGEIIVKKRKKQGGRRLVDAEVDIRPMVNEFKVVSVSGNTATLFVNGRLDASGGLNVDLLINALKDVMGVDYSHEVCRLKVNIGDIAAK